MNHKRVVILISGGGSNMVALLDSMRGDHPARAVLVISNDPAAAGLARAELRGIKTAVINHRDFHDRPAFETALNHEIKAVNPDILCLAGFMRILTPAFTAHWQGRMLNIHPSLLPAFPGLNTHQRALDAGESVHGCTVHEVTGHLDHGPLRGQARVAVLAGDTAKTLAARVLVQEHRLYPAVLARFATGNCEPVHLP